jgi:hypothetical protein
MWKALGAWRPGSGPEVARLFHRLLAIVFLIAWASLGAQVHVLIGSRGLLPAGVSDEMLSAGMGLGLLLSAAALLGVFPRACFAALVPLYAAYTLACGTFLAFQWDNMLIESALLAAFLSRTRPSPLAHLALRLLLFKLYFESGIAKWQSHLGDWQDGSAMTFYYETSPIPGPLAWQVHALPPGWHHFESWAALALELLVPLFIFAPRRLRIFAFAAFTGFQLIDILTANYGYFCYLSAALGVFLLDDADVARLRARLKLRPAPMPVSAAPPSGVRAVAGMILLALYAGISGAEAVARFTDWDALARAVAPVTGLAQRYRLINTYHLFGHITRERIEPELQTFDGAAFQAHDLKYKPGDLARAPPWVSPHQPRVDFQLWFYGLSFRRGMPLYVANLLHRLCEEPAAVQGLFAAPLPERPHAARVAFWRYNFTTREERRASGHFWKRQFVGATEPLQCEGQK